MGSQSQVVGNGECQVAECKGPSGKAFTASLCINIPHSKVIVWFVLSGLFREKLVIIVDDHVGILPTIDLVSQEDWE